jgi:hypothetical protein
MRTTLSVIALFGTLVLGQTALAEPTAATLYKDPQCGCCQGYAEYLSDNGFTVEVVPTDELAEISRQAGVPEGFQGCHTMFVDGYVVDGHVPVEVVRRLLQEKPDIVGIALPGMPAGSPGMSGLKSAPFVVYSLSKDGGMPAIYAVE